MGIRDRLRTILSEIAAPTPSTPPPLSPTRTPAVERMLSQMRPPGGESRTALRLPTPPPLSFARPGLELVTLPRIAVLITTILPRQASFIRVLRGLAAQTRKPDFLFVRLDCGDVDPAVQDAWTQECRPFMANAAHAVSTERSWSSARGAGFRWLHHDLARLLEPNDILITLDDDIVPRAAFVEHTARLCVYDNAVVTWHGWTERPGGPASMLTKAPSSDARTCAVGAGVACYRWRWVSDLASHPLAATCLFAGPRCDDDALLSLSLWENGVYVLRPAGTPPCDETEESQAATATHRVHNSFRHGQRLGLAITHDAPLIALEFPGPVGAEQGLVTTLGVGVSKVVLRPRIHAAAHAHDRTGEIPLYGAAPAFFDQLEGAILHLPHGAHVVEYGVTRATRWLGLYARALGHDHTVIAQSPETHDWVLNASWRQPTTKPYRSLLHFDDASVRFDLLIVAPNHHQVVPPSLIERSKHVVYLM